MEPIEEIISEPEILIVEDETIIAIDIETRLSSLGYKVIGSAKSGEEVLSFVDDKLPDLILMDINLGGKLDGIETSAKIREKYDIPIIYLTAYADEKTLSRAKLTQPYGYIIKPFDNLAVRSTIETALYKYNAEKKIKEDEKWLNIILNSISDAIIATDSKGKILFINPVAESLTGWAKKDALNKDLNKVYNISVYDNPAARSIIEKDQKDEMDNSAKYSLLTSMDGTKTIIKDSATTIKNDNNIIIGVVLVFREVKKLAGDS
ncbi:MAG: response regulator [Ignavibacteriaceae bacterium]